jgi:hypothetical protein
VLALSVLALANEGFTRALVETNTAIMKIMAATDAISFGAISENMNN